MLRTRWKNWRLKVARWKLEKKYNRASDEAKQKKDLKVLEEWYSVNGWEFDVIDAEIKENISRDVLDQAERLYLPTPGHNDKDKWIPDDDLGSTGHHWKVLTPESMTELNGVIRQERRARREVSEWWIKIIGGFVTILTGLVGAGIGLVAVWKK